MKKIAILLTLALLAVPVALPASDIELAKKSTLESIVQSGTLRICMEAGYMPFEMRDKKGAIVGFDPDVANEMAKDMGVKADLKNTAWEGIIGELLTGKCDIIMSGMTINQERNLKVNFVEPVITIGQTIIVAKKHEGKVKSYKDLNDKKFVVTSKLGTTGEQSTKRMIPKATYKSFETEQEAAMEVISGRADAFVYDHPYNAIFFAEKGAGKVFWLDQPFTFEPIGWAIRKGDPDFLNFLSNFLRQIKGDGRYDAFYTKWFKSADWTKDVVQ